MLGESVSRNALLLGLFAVLCTAIVAGTFLTTGPAISDNIRQAEERALLEIFPKSQHDNSMLDDAHAVNDSALLGLRKEKHFYIARMGGTPVGVILPATARDGYTGDIDLIVGIRVDGSVAGVRVLSHRETPGLGDTIESKKSGWLKSFTGKSLLNPTEQYWQVKKDGGVFDQFTGATITPRAATRAVKNALKYFDANRQDILETEAAVQATGHTTLTPQEADNHG